MSLGDWFKRLFASPTESAAEQAAEREEYGTPDEGEEELEGPQQSWGGASVAGLANEDAAEVAEADLEEFEPPAGPAS